MHIYTTDHDGYLPYAAETQDGGEPDISWDERLRPYLGAPLEASKMNDYHGLSEADGHEILKCPMDPLRGQWAPDNATRSYAMAAPVGREWIDRPLSLPDVRDSQLHIDSLPAPSQTLLLTEFSYLPNLSSYTGNVQGSTRGAIVHGANEQHPDYAPSMIALSAAKVQVLHGTAEHPMCNYLFVDGHVRIYEPAQTIGPNGSMAGGVSQGYWTADPDDN